MNKDGDMTIDELQELLLNDIHKIYEEGREKEES